MILFNGQSLGPWYICCVFIIFFIDVFIEFFKSKVSAKAQYAVRLVDLDSRLKCRLSRGGRFGLPTPLYLYDRLGPLAFKGGHATKILQKLDELMKYGFKKKCLGNESRYKLM